MDGNDKVLLSSCDAEVTLASMLSLILHMPSAWVFVVFTVCLCRIACEIRPLQHGSVVLPLTWLPPSTPRDSYLTITGKIHTHTRFAVHAYLTHNAHIIQPMILIFLGPHWAAMKSVASGSLINPHRHHAHFVVSLTLGESNRSSPSQMRLMNPLCNRICYLKKLSAYTEIALCYLSLVLAASSALCFALPCPFWSISFILKLSASICFSTRTRSSWVTVLS